MICDNAVKGISIKTRGNMISDAREKLHYISGKKISSKTSIKTPEACAGLFRDMIHLRFGIIHLEHGFGSQHQEVASPRKKKQVTIQSNKKFSWKNCGNTVEELFQVLLQLVFLTLAHMNSRSKRV